MHSLYIQGKMTRTLLCFDEFISFTSHTKHVDFNKRLIVNFNVMPESPKFQFKVQELEMILFTNGPTPIEQQMYRTWFQTCDTS